MADELSFIHDENRLIDEALREVLLQFSVPPLGGKMPEEVLTAYTNAKFAVRQYAKKRGVTTAKIIKTPPQKINHAECHDCCCIKNNPAFKNKIIETDSHTKLVDEELPYRPTLGDVALMLESFTSIFREDLKTDGAYSHFQNVSFELSRVKYDLPDQIRE